jgi:hypothetical protein
MGARRPKIAARLEWYAAARTFVNPSAAVKPFCPLPLLRKSRRLRPVCQGGNPAPSAVPAARPSLSAVYTDFFAEVLGYH